MDPFLSSTTLYLMTIETNQKNRWKSDVSTLAAAEEHGQDQAVPQGLEDSTANSRS